MLTVNLPLIFGHCSVDMGSGAALANYIRNFSTSSLMLVDFLPS